MAGATVPALSSQITLSHERSPARETVACFLCLCVCCSGHVTATCSLCVRPPSSEGSGSLSAMPQGSAVASFFRAEQSCVVWRDGILLMDIGFLLPFGYCEWCCREHSCSSVCLNFSDVGHRGARSGIAGSSGLPTGLIVTRVCSWAAEVKGRGPEVS